MPRRLTTTLVIALQRQRHLGSLGDDGDAVQHRRAIDDERAFAGEQQHRQAARRDDDLGARIDQRLDLRHELGAHGWRRSASSVKAFMKAGRFILSALVPDHPLAEPVHAHLAVVPGNEDRIDGHETQPMAHAQRGEQVGLAQADHRDVDGAADLEQAGLLEVADHESVVARLFRLQRMADDLRGAAELGQRMEGVIGRIEAVNLEAHARARDLVEQRLQALDIRRLFDRMDEALVPDPRLILRHCPASSAFSSNMRTACLAVPHAQQCSGGSPDMARGRSGA